VEASLHNSATAAYYLLLKRHNLLGHYSKADINSPVYDSKLAIPNKPKTKQNVLNVEEEILIFK